MKRFWGFFGPCSGRLGAFLERVESVKGRLEMGRLGLPWGRLRHVFKRLESFGSALGHPGAASRRHFRPCGVRVGATRHAPGAFKARLKRLEPFWGVLG